MHWLLWLLDSWRQHPSLLIQCLHLLRNVGHLVQIVIHRRLERSASSPERRMHRYHVLALLALRYQSRWQIDALLELKRRLGDDNSCVVGGHHFRLFGMKRRLCIRLAQIIQRLLIGRVHAPVILRSFMLRLFWNCSCEMSSRERPGGRHPGRLVQVLLGGLRRTYHINVLSHALRVRCIRREFSISVERMFASCCAYFHNEPSCESAEVLHFPFLLLHLFNSISSRQQGHIVARHRRGLLHCMVSRIQHLKAHSPTQNAHGAIHNA